MPGVGDVGRSGQPSHPARVFIDREEESWAREEAEEGKEKTWHASGKVALLSSHWAPLIGNRDIPKAI